jgi:hypothetical protein
LREAAMAKQLETGAYLLEDTEREAYASAARMVERVDGRRLDLTHPLAEMDYLLVMCAHLIVNGEDRVDETLGRIVEECLEERRRRTC